MKIGLFVPCHVNELAPEVAIATLELLEGYGLTVDYPLAQTCCGQPQFNNGDVAGAHRAALRFADVFAGYDYIVSPGTSCVSHIGAHTPDTLADTRSRVYELVEFLQDVLKVGHLPKPVYFPHKVSLHQSCHGLRLRAHATPSERMLPWQSRLERILSLVDGVSVVHPARRDECCGFGGSFCVDEPEVSVAMGGDRVDGHAATGAEFIVGAEPSCLMHMGGVIRAQGKPIRPLHIALLLTGRGGA